jgi:hypothetical protein
MFLSARSSTDSPEFTLLLCGRVDVDVAAAVAVTVAVTVGVTVALVIGVDVDVIMADADLRGILYI